ncbi:MAG: conjugal transfer protein TraF, partial [Pseudobdellovibrionaceae bacterium]
NPTDENIKQWFELMKKKNELQTNLQVRMHEYMAKNNTVNVQTQVAVAKAPEKDSDVKIDPSRFRLRMYFESTCPHCKRMFHVLEKLQDKGFQIEALQVDSGPVPEVEKIVPIVRADPEDLKKHGIKGVPFLLVADTKKKSLLPPIEGYHDLEEILRLLKAASRI